MKRSELPDSVFGIPEERKYPMPDKRHTLSAIKLFGHVEPKYEEELARNIIKNMKKYNIPESAVGKDNKLRKYIDKYYNESTRLIEEQSTSSVKVYHLSQSNLDGKTLSPRVPSNYFTKNGYEDEKTARVCFAKSIDMCLRALSQKCTGMELFVHIPDGKYNIYVPSTKDVPDCKITSEVWIKEPVKLKCIGKIKVIKDKGEDGIPYKYGDKTAELYDWEWKWIEKINEGYITNDPNKKIPEYVLQAAGEKCIEFLKWCRMDDSKFTYIHPVQPNKAWVNEEDSTFIFANYDGKLEWLPQIIETFNKNNLFKYGKFRVYAKDMYNETELSNHQNKKFLCGEVIEYDGASSINHIEESNDYLEENAMNEISSNINSDYHSNGKKSLSSFKKEKISKESLNKYKKDFKALSHIRENCLGYIYLYKNIPMAVIAVEEKSDCNFIQAIEISKEYQGYGLSKQLLDVAVKELKATKLSVNRKNKLAISIYKKYGFKEYNSSDTMIFMTINKSTISEFSVGTGPVVGITSSPEPIYIVNYLQNNVFSGAQQERFGICKTGMKDLHIYGGKYNRLHLSNLEEFEKEASNIRVYRYTGTPLSSIYSIIEDSYTDLDFYRLLTGEDINKRSDIEFNPNFVRESYIKDELFAITECVNAGVKEIDNKYEIPLIGLNEDGRVYNYYRDLDGVYIKNEVTNMRSGSYMMAEDIPEEVSKLVKKGVY